MKITKRKNEENLTTENTEGTEKKIQDYPCVRRDWRGHPCAATAARGFYFFLCVLCALCGFFIRVCAGMGGDIRVRRQPPVVFISSSVVLFRDFRDFRGFSVCVMACARDLWCRDGRGHPCAATAARGFYFFLCSFFFVIFVVFLYVRWPVRGIREDTLVPRGFLHFYNTITLGGGSRRFDIFMTID